MIKCYAKDGSKPKEAECMTIKRSVGIYNKQADPYRDYLKSKIDPEVWEHLERARRRWGSIPIKPEQIDQIIDYQNISKKKAIRYIKYKFLGECYYTDVFGPEAEKEYCESVANTRIDEIDQKINLIMEALGVAINEKNNLIKLKRA